MSFTPGLGRDLVGHGTVLPGSPLGDNVDAGDALLVICANDEASVRAIALTTGTIVITVSDPPQD